MELAASHDYNGGGRQSSKGRQQAFIPMPICMMPPAGQQQQQPPPPPHVLMGAPLSVCNFNCSVPPVMPPPPPMMSAKEIADCFLPPPPIGRHIHQQVANKQSLLPNPLTVSPEFSSETSLPQDDSAIVIDLTGSERPLPARGGSHQVTSASTSTQTPIAPVQVKGLHQMHSQQMHPQSQVPPPHHYPVLSYLDSLSIAMWQYFIDSRQTSGKYAKKVHFRNALHIMVSSVFENSKLFIVGSSINGFGTDQSDMDLCLTVTSQELQAKRETSVILTQLMTPLRNCSFIRNCTLIRAKVPILKFRDSLSGVDCDLNVNNVVGIYNTHLLAMYTRVDWRVRPLGMFVKHWAKKMDIHDGSRGRLSTYPLILMLLQYLQCGCSPPVIPNLQARFPKLFNYERPVVELDMRLQLPWPDLRSTNTATLGELFTGFVCYYAGFDFNRWAVSVKHGAPMPIDIAIRCLPPHEQAHTACSFKIFVEEPFCQANAARCLYDDSVLALIQQAFTKTDQALRLQKPLESLWAINSTLYTSSSADTAV